MTSFSDTTPQPAPPWRDPTDATPVRMILRHPRVFLGVLGVCLGICFAYLRFTTRLYTSAALLRVEAGATRVIGSPEAPRSSDETIAFLNAEAAVLTSTPVLEAALKSPDVRGGAFSSATPDPISNLRKNLRVGVGRKDQIIDVEFDAPSGADAAAIVNAVVDAYVLQESRQAEEKDRKLMNLLSGEREEERAAARAHMDEMLRVVKQAGTPILDGRDKAQELSSLRSSHRVAEGEAAAAATTYQQAVASLGGDPALLAQLKMMTSAQSVPTNSELENSEVRLAITDLELKKQDLMGARTYLPANPRMIGLQQQLDRLRLLYAASAYGRVLQMRAQVDRLQTVIKDQEAAAQDLPEKAVHYAQAELALKRADRHLDTLDDRINELKARRDSEPLRVTMVERARPAIRPAKPDVPRYWAMAGIAGFLFGSWAAYAREAGRMNATAARQGLHDRAAFEPETAMEPDLDAAPGKQRLPLMRRIVSARGRSGADDRRSVRIG